MSTLLVFILKMSHEKKISRVQIQNAVNVKEEPVEHRAFKKKKSVKL